MTTSLLTLTNCDLKVYSHIPFKPLQDYDYRSKKPYKTTFFMLEWRCPLSKFPMWVILNFIMHYWTWKRLWFLLVLMWQFTLSLNSLPINLCILSIRFSSLRFFVFLGKLIHFLFVYIRKLSFFSFFFNYIRCC